MKLLCFAIAIFGLASVVVIICPTIIYLYFLTQATIFTDAIEKSFDASLQSISKDKPFIYKITSIETSFDQSKQPQGWCIVIDPELEMVEPPSDEPLRIKHFFFNQRAYIPWFHFDATMQKQWQEMGCENW